MTKRIEMCDHSSVIQDWLMLCSWKMQTVLLASFRGCDGLDKNDPSKHFTKKMRSSILKNADTSSGFHGSEVILTEFEKTMIDKFFSNSLDKYPVHWLMHFLHASEIIFYKCHIHNLKEYWGYFYKSGVKALHLNVETIEEMEMRLSDFNVKGESN